MTDFFYKKFEDKHRGARELIKERLQVYLPFILPLKDSNSSATALDLGCGRGEWLELMGEQGFVAKGIDIDDGLLLDCRELGLDVLKAEAIEHLQSTPTESVDVITAFHVVEHIQFDELRKLVEESFRVLTPAGILILETPNPENITVGSSSFYLDPTHNRPIPSDLLYFLSEYYGFKKIKKCRLNGSDKFIGGGITNILDVLGGVSPDYSIVSQKDAPDNAGKLGLTNQAFNTNYGLSLNVLAGSFEDRTVDQNLRIQHLEEEVKRIMRVMYPFIWFAGQLKLVRQEGVLARATSLCKKTLRTGKSVLEKYIITNPKIKLWLVRALEKLGLYDFLRTKLRSQKTHFPISINQLNKSACAIYRELNDVISTKGNNN
jgi:SAM-dependent methyltransferase